MSDEKKRERAPQDKEMLAISRCGAVLRKLGLDAEARFRVVEYLMKRAANEVDAERKVQYQQQRQEQTPSVSANARDNASMPWA
jgi:hypothetical protein